MNRATHLQVANIGKLLLEGVIDGRPFKEKNYLHKQPIYLSPTRSVNRYVFPGFEANYAGTSVTASLTMADLGYPFPSVSETFSGWVDFVTDVGAPLPAKVLGLATAGHLSLATFDSILLESPPSGALTGGPTLTSATVPSDLDIVGTNLTAIAPVTSELRVVDVGRIDGTDATASRVFGTTKYLLVRNADWQDWLRIPLTGTLTAAECVTAINNAVAAHAATIGKLRPMVNPRRTWDEGYYPNIFAVTPAVSGTTHTVGLFAHGEGSRIEIASVATAEALVGSGNTANVLLLGLGTGTLSDTGTGTRGVVPDADITEGVGTTLTVGSGDLPGGTAAGDLVYLSINDRDLFVEISA